MVGPRPHARSQNGAKQHFGASFLKRDIMAEERKNRVLRSGTICLTYSFQRDAGTFELKQRISIETQGLSELHEYPSFTHTVL